MGSRCLEIRRWDPSRISRFELIQLQKALKMAPRLGQLQTENFSRIRPVHYFLNAFGFDTVPQTLLDRFSSKKQVAQRKNIFTAIFGKFFFPSGTLLSKHVNLTPPDQKLGSDCHKLTWLDKSVLSANKVFKNLRYNVLTLRNLFFDENGAGFDTKYLRLRHNLAGSGIIPV